jgi:hypothetical protein
LLKTKPVKRWQENLPKYIPLIGTIVSCTVSYAACVHFLRHEIDLLEKDTLNLSYISYLTCCIAKM